MLKMIFKWIIYAVLIMITAWIIPGISVSNFWSAMLVCIIIGLINVFVRPVVTFISIPINFLTLGLFSFVINALLLMLAGALTPGFEVNGFLSALLVSVLLSVFSGFLNRD